LLRHAAKETYVTAPVVLCFSHLRWNFVFQRPNHLMSRCARDRRVLFVEPPLFDTDVPFLERVELAPNLLRVVPHQRDDQSSAAAQDEITRKMIASLCDELGIAESIHWFYTPMMLPVARGLRHSLVVYDCMDELANFLHAPKELVARERELMKLADVMFTGGMALYEAKRDKHPNVHGIPSSVDVLFFSRGRAQQPDPADQAAIARPRVGYAGVIDERIDIELLDGIAQARPDLQLVMLGPIVKISPDALPKRPNIHYLGGKPYDELPAYMAGWDVAFMPFAVNEATRFISPTKTPEYLAAGRRVVSTPIRDVVEPYERLGLVRIGRSTAEFIAQLDAAIADDGSSHADRDRFLAQNSWDKTWQRMHGLMQEALATRRARAPEVHTNPALPERDLHV
jgi:UDP-galactopyranose mutase